MGKQVEPSLRLGSDLNRGAGEPQQGAAGRVQKKKNPKCSSICPEDETHFKLLPRDSVATFNSLFTNILREMYYS